MRKIFLILMVIASVGMTGCTRNPYTQPAGPAGGVNAMYNTINMVNPNEAVIVFFRSEKQAQVDASPGLVRHGQADMYPGGGKQAPVIEGDEDVKKLSFITVLSKNNTKYLHRTTPGRHWYVVNTVRGRGDMLEADLEAGKTYYAYISYDKAFIFKPVSDDADKSFREDLASCIWIQNLPRGQEWFLENLSSLLRNYTAALAKHQAVMPEYRKIIRPEYGTNTPVH